MIKKIAYLALVLIILSSCTGVATTKPSSNGEDKTNLLKERATAFWQAMMARDWDKVYDMYDPFFRAKVSSDFFSGRKIPIYYKSFEIGEVNIKGNVALVNVKLIYTIDDVGKFGQKIKIEDADKSFAEKWLFVDNNWYKQFEDHITGGTFAYY